MDQVGGRKFIFTIICVVLAFVLVVLGKTTADIFFEFLKFVGAAYFVANVANSGVDIIKTNKS